MGDPVEPANIVCTPHLKKVLKSYQLAATKSLNGPRTFMSATNSLRDLKSPLHLPETSGNASTTKDEFVYRHHHNLVNSVVAEATKKSPSAIPSTSEYDPFLAPPPFPIQQPPIFTPADHSRCERSETVLEGETISCFVVGGEKRLCLPQILNTVLKDFTLHQINNVCDDLQIFCSRCSLEQLEVLKVTAVLPLSAPSCGLITKTDAERLCAELLHRIPAPPSKQELLISDKQPAPFHFEVKHACFGKCHGLYFPDLYVTPFSRCIKCRECTGYFTPQKFVCHAHQRRENRTCHWGFDSANWRSYLLVHEHQEDVKELQVQLAEMKSRFDYAHKYKRKQFYEEVSDPKRYRMEETFPPYPAFPWDPSFAYWYYAGLPWTRFSAFKPWLPGNFDKDGKPFVPSLPPPHPPTPHSSAPPVQVLLQPHESVPSSVSMCLPQEPSVIPRSDGAPPITSFSSCPPKMSLMHYLKANQSQPSTPIVEMKNKFHEKRVESIDEEDSGTFRPSQSRDAMKTFTDTEDSLSDSSLSTLSGNEPVECVVEELPNMNDDVQGLVTILEENDLLEETKSKIMNEVKCIISKYKTCLRKESRNVQLLQKELDCFRKAKKEKLELIQIAKNTVKKDLNEMQQLYKHTESVEVQPKDLGRVGTMPNGICVSQGYENPELLSHNKPISPLSPKMLNKKLAAATSREQQHVPKISSVISDTQEKYQKREYFSSDSSSSAIE